MKQDDALALLAALVTATLTFVSSRRESRRKKQQKVEQAKILDAYSRNIQQSDVKQWFRKVLPPKAPRQVIEGRLWIEHPVRINDEIYTITSTSTDGVYAVDRYNMCCFIPWNTVETLHVSLDA